ncbi:MAG TPA: endolytic transglycosylase MltG [Vicinamibacterales bacterium]|nr:endolytic transglycosylase MltG [Vicinamibacterales bacterium]
MKRLIIAAAVALLVVLIALGAWVWIGVSRPYRGYTADEQFVEIPQGAGPISIGRRLAEAGVVRDATSFRLAVWLSGEGRRLQAGDYRFDRPMSAREVVGKIARGEVYLRPVTFPEGLTIRQMAAIYESKGFGSAADFIEASRDTRAIADIDPQATDLEGYLFPETYNLPRRATAAQLIARMVEGFRSALTPELRQQAAARGLSVRAMVTLASIVEKETARAEERPIVAGVYANRIRIGMPLQCDPTVIYALERAGRYTGNITRDDLQFDSPYNTYRYPGLPPGPIASPGVAALRAAAQPADVAYLYFVSRNDGSHVFAATLAEHNRNVEEYQRKYFRDRRRQPR